MDDSSAQTNDHQTHLPFVDNVIPWSCRQRAAGRKTALATLIHVDGNGPRPVGSQVAIADSGDFVGLISGGCVEAALAHEAVLALREGRNRTLRYGAGSPYMDIQLPCGSAIEIYIDVGLSDETLNAIASSADIRVSTALVTDLTHGQSRLHPCAPRAEPKLHGDEFVRPFIPQPRVLIFGAHPAAQILAEMAGLAGIEPVVGDQFSVDQGLKLADRWTAIALFFHDHVDEPRILDAFRHQPLFFLGALGSKSTHALRCDALRELGWSAAELDRIQGPIGEWIAAKTPPEIAVSVLASLIKAWRTPMGEDE